MRRHRRTFSLAVFLSAIAWVCAWPASQQGFGDDPPAAAARAGRGHVGVKADMASVLLVDGHEVATLEAKQRHWVEVDAGVVELEVRLRVVPAVRRIETVDVPEGARTRVTLRLHELAAQYQVSEARVASIEAVDRHSFLDPATGLQWTAALTDNELSWQAAQQHCLSLSLGGKQDWRLPSLDELSAVVVPHSETGFKVLPSFDLGEEHLGVQVWSSTDAAEIVTPGDRASLAGVTMVHDRNPVPLHQRMPPPPVPVVIPGARAATLDLASGKELSAAKDGAAKHHALCVRPAVAPAGPDGD